MVTLILSDVSFSYVARRTVLREVSLSLRPGAVTAIVGPNGAGKSTLLRLMAGVRTPGAGRATLDGVEVASLPHRVRARRIGYLAQRPSVAFAFTLAQFVRLGRYAAGRGGGDGDAVVTRALERVDLAGRADDLFGALSAGQQQRASLARVMAQLDGVPAPVVLADEPVSAMDPRHALDAMSILASIAASGGAVAVVLHDLNLAVRYCSEAVVLGEDGRIAAAGPAGQVLTPRVLDPVFGVRFRTLADPADPRLSALLASDH